MTSNRRKLSTGDACHGMASGDAGILKNRGVILYFPAAVSYNKGDADMVGMKMPASMEMFYQC